MLITLNSTFKNYTGIIMYNADNMEYIYQERRNGSSHGRTNILTKRGVSINFYTFYLVVVIVALGRFEIEWLKSSGRNLVVKMTSARINS